VTAGKQRVGLNELLASRAPSPLPQAPSQARPGRTTSPVPPPPPPMSPRGTQGAVEAVRRARDSARDDPRGWEPFTVRLPGALVRRLKVRLAADQAATKDFTLALSHYLEAALATIPTDLAKAAAWGFAWRKRAGGAPARNVPTGSLARKDTALVMHLLPARLGTLERKPAAWEIMAEALARLLDGLDADPVQREYYRQRYSGD